MKEKEIIDATDCVAGRLASKVAKLLLKGKQIEIINAERAVITGSPAHTLEKFQQRIDRGDPYKGPHYPREPHKIFRRMVRGMLPYKKPRGRKAFKNLKVHLSTPEKLKEEDKIKLEEVKVNPEDTYTTLAEISEKLTSKKYA